MKEPMIYCAICRSTDCRMKLGASYEGSFGAFARDEQKALRKISLPDLEAFLASIRWAPE